MAAFRHRRVNVGFGEGGVRRCRLTDSDGQTVPSQILESTHYADGGLKTARIAFVARDVPAIGYRLITSSPHAASRRQADRPSSHGGDARSRSRMSFYRVDARSHDRGDHEPAFQSRRLGGACPGPGNVVARQQDRGDLWELYQASTVAAESP